MKKERTNPDSMEVQEMIKDAQKLRDNTKVTLRQIKTFPNIDKEPDDDAINKWIKEMTLKMHFDDFNVIGVFAITSMTASYVLYEYSIKLKDLEEEIK